MNAWVDAVRRDTPGAANLVHFNNAGAALSPQVVVDAVIDHVRREAAIGGYEAAADATARLDGVYESVARLIGTNSSNIAIVENATRAWDMAVYGYPFSPGDRVVTARAEYASNVIGLLQLQRRRGIEIVLIDDDEHGQVSLEHLADELDAGAEMVALTHAPTNGGLINPATAVGELCREHDVFYVLDACQSLGQVPIDVGAIGCDVLSATSRKYLRGPRGVGLLYVGERALERCEPPFLDLHAATWTTTDTYEVRPDAKRFENWETNVAAKLGLGAAVDYALDLGIDTTWARIRDLGDTLRRGLAALDGTALDGKGVTRGGIVTFTMDGRTSEEVKRSLADARINVSISPPEFSRYAQPTRPPLVRASVHYYNTEEEIDRFLDVVSNAER